MKTIRKTLSLLLTVCMLMSVVCISYADTTEETEVTLPSKLIDLNLDNMVKSTTDTTSGVVNAGTSESTTIQIKSNTSGLNLTKGVFTNSSVSQTDYIDLDNAGTWNWTDPNTFFFISDNAMETSANTISFWVDSDNTSKPSNQKYGNIINYYIKYSNEETDISQNLELSEVNAEESIGYTWNTGDTFTEGINMDSSKGWTHVTITNPLLSDGTKTMGIYINGELKKSVALTIPTGATLTSAGLYFGGSATKPSYANRVKYAKYGDVAVYNGVLTQEQITKLYTDQAPAYVPLDLETVPKLFDLDLTNFSSTGTSGANGAVNKGISTSSEINLFDWRYNTTSDRIYLTKSEMSNTAGQILEYINYSSKGATWTSSLKTTMSDLAWEQEDTTISFWMTPATDSITTSRILASYNLAYTDKNSTVTNKYINIWEVGNKNIKTANDGSTSVTAKDGFNHFVIVNKKADNDGNKSFDLYVNGAFYKTVSVEKPTDTTLTNASLSFGYSPGASNTQARYVLDFGKVQVYKGALAAADVKSLYDLQAPEFEELTLSEAEKLLDLNIDNFGKTTTAGSSGAINAGTSTNAVLDIYSTAQVEVGKSKHFDTALNPLKSFIHMSHNFGHQISSGTALQQHFDISDKSWENQPTTISFWADIDRGVQQTSGQSYSIIAQYDLAYTLENGSTENKAVSIWQWGLDTDTNYHWADAYSGSNIFSMNNSRDWTHVALVNPMTDSSGNKKVALYINGSYIKTITLAIPEGAVLTNATIRFGGDRNNGYLPGDLSIGDVKVYKAQFTADIIKEIYEAEKAGYTDVAEAKITFKNGNAKIVRLNGITADGTVNINVDYEETVVSGCKIIAAAFDANGNFINASSQVSAEGNTSGSFVLPLLADTKIIKVYTWTDDDYMPVQKIASIQYNDN